MQGCLSWRESVLASRTRPGEAAGRPREAPGMITRAPWKTERGPESPLHRVVERHLEELPRVWHERFLRQHGAPRSVVKRVLPAFMTWGS
jgi:hypothetical protein